MTAFARRVAALSAVAGDRLERLAGGDLSEVLLVRREDGRAVVAKGGPMTGVEAAMLRRLAELGLPVPAVEGEHDEVLLLDFVPNDGVLSPRAWADIGTVVAQLHSYGGKSYGWPSDYCLGTVQLHNRERGDWPGFWGEQRLASAASLLDRPWRERVDRLMHRLGDRLPETPPAALLHGDLWSGNLLVADGRLAAFVDPACYHGHSEVDLAMLTLFDTPPDTFWQGYGRLEAGWRDRRPVYQLFPALVHLRLFGAGYAGLVDRLLGACGV